MPTKSKRPGAYKLGFDEVMAHIKHHKRVFTIANGRETKRAVRERLEASDWAEFNVEITPRGILVQV